MISAQCTKIYNSCHSVLQLYFSQDLLIEIFKIQNKVYDKYFTNYNNCHI